jgi:hypothetical protein
MPGLAAVGRCDVAGPFGAWLLGWLGFSRSWREPEGRGKVYLQHPAQGPKDSPGCLRRGFDQGRHLGLGELVLQLAAEAGRLVRHEPDQPPKFSGQQSLRLAGRCWVGVLVARGWPPRRGRLPGPGRRRGPDPPGAQGRLLARGPEFAGLGAGGEFGEPRQEVAEPGHRQKDQRP